ncbi:unnamed protein product [Cyprideis torosa]|uniref:ABC-type xenobiotic transporter n=2 Tax=Cyprideis torosa TaxID=163714 RepID=A0A7R8ZR15_9CRUS|nr:unnamed protein product [Cyprideis torosa]CAG0893263.1 unnamed protein product [Cyprideis torosa]
MSGKKEEKESLIPTFDKDYGAVKRTKEGNERKTERAGSSEEASPQTVPVFRLFRYADKIDFLLLTIGTLAAVVHGAGFPALGLVFGQMTNEFLKQAMPTSNSTTAPVANATTSMWNTAPPFSNWNASTTMLSMEGTANGTLGPTTSSTLVSDYETTSSVPRGFTTGTVPPSAFSNVSSPFPQPASADSSINDLLLSTYYSTLRTLAPDLAPNFDSIDFGTIMASFSLFYVYIALAVFIASILQVTCYSLACERQMYKMRHTFFYQVIRQEVGWFDRHQSGELSMKLNDDLERVKEGIGDKFSLCIESLASFLSGVVVGMIVSWRLSLAVLALSPLTAGTSAFVGKISTKKYKFMAASFFIVLFIMYGSYALTFWYGARLVRFGMLSPGGVFTVFFSVMIGSFQLGNALPHITYIGTAQGAAAKIFEIMDNIPRIDPYSSLGARPTSIRGKIQFNHVNFEYPTRPDVQILKDMQLQINPGQTVALVGSSGCGKSTVVNLLLRFYDPTSGAITLDGMDLRTLNLAWLRSNIGVVSQEPVLFDGSIAENIRHGKEDATFEEIVAAARMANAHDFIMSLPMAQKGRTTLVIAHRLSTIQNADVIFAFEAGQIKECGSHSELMSKEGLYYSLVTTQTFTGENGATTDGETDQEKKQAERPKKTSTQKTQPRRVVRDKALARLQEEAEKEKVRQASLWEIFRYTFPEYNLIFMGMVGCVLSGLTMPIYAFLYSEVFNTFTTTGEELKRRSEFWSLMFIALAAFGGLSGYIRTIGIALAGDRMTTRMRLLSFKNILRQEVSWFDDEAHSTGKISTRLATDAPMVKAVASHRMAVVVAAASTIAGSMVIAFVFGWKLALAITAASPVLIAAGAIQVRFSKGGQRKDAKLMSDAGHVTTESLQNIRTVHALGRQRAFFSTYVTHLQAPYQWSKKQSYIYGLIYAFSQGVIFFIYAGAFRYGAELVDRGEMTPTNVYRVFFAITFSAVSIGQTNSYISEYTKSRISASLMIHLINLKPKIDIYHRGGVQKAIAGSIQFKEVYFCYPQRPDAMVLSGLSFSLKPGQTLALVGPSGCGKSTVVALLQRFYDVTSGEIAIDGLDLRTYNLAFIRRQMSVVSQEPVLFDCSIAKNIIYGLEEDADPTQEMIEHAAKQANIHDFIRTLPDGYETRVGEKGIQMSGGQKQRIAIARALIRNPKILLLDEATSALDTESEQIVQSALDVARAGRTCIIVAHRLSTIQNADLIAVIDQGRIAELGTHDELRARKGFYYKLTKRQQIHS